MAVSHPRMLTDAAPAAVAVIARCTQQIETLKAQKKKHYKRNIAVEIGLY